ncbi:hypothetical protein [Photobacterium galatheae]|uniref:Uncharacterized protein n=1 Tax=Photobacterium galatheae TaxID=1654360 RepID=A0A066RLI3_9GAMM|nr:hypothetical protein [Photobacterium galatheae]KDM91305.1 hypothetical protein EA58_12095 [Photobacterium galatheae]MCM0150294.1 hypothetical protein [Photobacterium galatheae]
MFFSWLSRWDFKNSLSEFSEMMYFLNNPINVSRMTHSGAELFLIAQIASPTERKEHLYDAATQCKKINEGIISPEKLLPHTVQGIINPPSKPA